MSQKQLKPAIARFCRILGILWLCWVGSVGILGCSVSAIASTDSPVAPTAVYDYRDRPSPDGIGKVYMGREIAKVMGHTEAMWLERPSRTYTEQPEEVVAALNLQPTDIVADIGAGTGYFSFRLSAFVPQGKVYAVDIQPEMVEILDFFKHENHVKNVQPVLGTVTDPALPLHSVDVALLVDAYHEFAYPYEMMTAIVRALKPGGRVVLVEYRKENPFVAIKGLHKMTQRQVKREMNAVGLVWQDTQEFLPQQHFMVFAKPVLPDPEEHRNR